MFKTPQGGNSGIGKETIKVNPSSVLAVMLELILNQALLSHGGKVYMACRNEESARSAIEQLKTETGKEAIFLPMDLADLNSVRRAAQEFLR